MPEDEGSNKDPAARKVRKRPSAAASTQEASEAAARPRDPNSIRPARKRARPEGWNETAQADRSRESSPDRSTAVPEHVRERFVQVRDSFYFPDGARAFTDRGNRLTTPSENTEVVRSLIDIARERGWEEIAVRGSARFRQSAWFAARTLGLQVRGYEPSEVEQGQLARTMARQEKVDAPTELRSDARSQDASGKPEAPRSREGPDGLILGKLLEHGPAPYQDNPRRPTSYFVKIEMAEGPRTIWGVDLERAFKESVTKPQPGEDIGLRALKQDAVTVKAPEHDAQGKIVGQKDLRTHRNQWIIEKREFFSARAAAARTLRDSKIDPKEGARRHPALLGTYVQMRAAELAAKRFSNPEDERQFVARVRTALADAMARGEPIPQTRLRDRTEKRSARPQAPKRTRDALVRD